MVEAKDIEALSGELTEPPEEPSLKDGIKINDLWFQHHSPYELDVLKPLSYSELEKLRSEDLPDDNVKQYIQERKETEFNYRKLLNSKDESSFLYATIVGFNKMEDALDYPGFTYYFKLTADQIDNVIFELIAGENKKDNIKADVGKQSLIKCLNFWIENEKGFKSYYDNVLQGDIDPRIEVIINFEVKPESFIPEIEQR